MKRGKLSLLLFFILVVPLVSASIVIQGPAQEKYNIGDTVQISGYIFETNDLKGFLSTAVICEDKEYPLQLIPLELEANKKVLFPESVTLPQITISAGMIGLCNVKIAITDGATEIDSSVSKQFSVIKDMDGKFTIDDSNIQVGSQLTLNGKITQKDGDLVSGIAEIYFKHNDTKYLIEVINVKDGQFSYIHKATATPQGEYQIDVLMRDTYGNEMLFEKVATFLLINKLSVMIETDKTEYLPGETIMITGTAKNAHMNNVMDADVEISLDSKNYQAEVKDGAFDYEIIIPTDIKTGKHTVLAIVKDSIGNNGGDRELIQTLAIPTKIENELNVLTVYPKEELDVTPLLLDQAGDKLDDTVLIEVIDPKNNLRVSKTISSNKKASFKVPEFAIPGEWKIKASKDKLSDEDKFTVKEKEEITADLRASSIYLNNIGNIKFKDKIEVQFEGDDDYKVRLTKSIMPNQTEIINLGTYAPDGKYDITIIIPNMAPLSFENVTIVDGKPIRMFNWLYIIFIIGFALFMLFFTLARPTKPKKPIPQSKKRKLAKINRATEDVHIMEEEKRKSLRDFKERVLEEIERTEKGTKDTFRSKRGGFYGKGDSSSNDENNGFANMFG